MRHVAILGLCGVLTLSPAAAEQSDELSDGMEMLSEGMQLFLRGLMSEMEPALRGLGDKIDELNAYHPPEILPNGDIIIRRKTPLEIERGEEGEIEL